MYKVYIDFQFPEVSELPNQGTVTAIELSEVENWLFGAKLGPEFGREFAAIRDPVIKRLMEELELPFGPSYFYQIWEIAGSKMCNETPLTAKEGAKLRQFEKKLQELGQTVVCKSIDNQPKTIHQWLWSMCRSVRDTLLDPDAVVAAT